MFYNIFSKPNVVLLTTKILPGLLMIVLLFQFFVLSFHGWMLKVVTVNDLVGGRIAYDNRFLIMFKHNRYTTTSISNILLVEKRKKKDLLKT